MEYEALVALSFQPLIFWLFTIFWLEVLEQKIELSNKFSHYLKFIWSLSQHASKWWSSPELRNTLSSVYGNEIWCKFALWAIFSHVFIAETCQKIGFLNLSWFFKFFYPAAQRIKVNWAEWCSMECLEKHLGDILSKTNWEILFFAWQNGWKTQTACIRKFQRTTKMHGKRSFMRNRLKKWRFVAFLLILDANVWISTHRLSKHIE